MYFDGASQRGGAGAGAVFITLLEEILAFSFTLKQCLINNVIKDTLSNSKHQQSLVSIKSN